MLDYKKFMEGSKEEYKRFFDRKLKKYGVDSASELSDEDKKRFYDEIDKEWNADHEAGTDGKVKKEWKKTGKVDRRCAGGDKRRTNVKSEEDDCEDDEEEKKKKKTTSYMEHEIEKACKKVRMSPGEIGDFFAALEAR